MRRPITSGSWVCHVVVGRIHATMCLDEVLGHVDLAVAGETEVTWPEVLKDTRKGALRDRYNGGFAEMTNVVPARRDLLSQGRVLGAIQTTRRCASLERYADSNRT